MPDQKILDYIKTEEQKGFAKATITTALLKIGWPQTQIDEAFASLNNQTPAAPVSQTPKQTPPQISNYLPGVKQLFGQAWQIEKDRFKTIGAIMLFPFAFLIIGLIVGLIGIFAKQNLIAIAVIGIAALFTIVFNICAPIALILAIKYRHEKIGFRQAYTKSIGKAIPLIILSILSGLIALTGLILFIVPAFIFGIWFSMAIYALVSDDAGIIASLKLSKQYVNGKFFAVLYRFIGFSIIIFLLSLLIGLIPIVNLFLGIINLLVLSPLSTIYSYLLYENLKNLNGKPISNQPSKLFVSLILFLLALIAFLLLLVLAYVIPNLIKNYSKPPTAYQYKQTLPNKNLNSLPAQTPMPTQSVNPSQIPAPIEATGSAETPTCTIDWSNFPPLIITGQPYTFSVMFNSNFGTAMPSVYIYPGGQALYRDSNSSGSNLNSVTVTVGLTGPTNGTYTLKPYLDNSSAQGVECNEKTFTVGEQNQPSPTP